MKRPFFYSGVNTYLPLVKFDLTPKLFFLYIWHLCTQRASQGRKAGENWFIYFLCQSDLNYFFLLMNCNLAREKKFCLDNPSRFLHFIFHQWKRMKKKKNVWNQVKKRNRRNKLLWWNQVKKIWGILFFSPL